MNSVVALVFAGLVATTCAAPSGFYGVGYGHGYPVATSAVVAGPSGYISSHQSSGAVTVAAAPAVVAAPAYVAAAPAVVSVHGVGYGGYGYGGFGFGHGAHVY